MQDLSANTAEFYATDFVKQLRLSSEVNRQCEWTCLLWSKEHWEDEAKKTQVNLQLTKERGSHSLNAATESLSQQAKFLNTAAQMYGRCFGFPEESCTVKNFDKCPFIQRRQELLVKGSLASVFVTILHKAAMYVLLEEHPLDSGFIDERYDDVYGVDLTSLKDIEASFLDGRFDTLYHAVLRRAKQLAGIET